MAFIRSRWGAALALGAATLLACTNRPNPQDIYLGLPNTARTHAVITVQPGSAAQAPGNTWRIRSTVRRQDGTTTDALLPETAPTSPLDYPITYSVVAYSGAGSVELWVDALDRDGNALGRGYATATLQEGTGISVQVALARSCNDTAQCDDGVFCNGAETCQDGMCLAGADPCPQSPFACVQTACVEAMADCSVGVDHAACPAADEGDGGSYERYCDPAAGCVRGKGCQMDADCQDGSFCNGQEVCAGKRCVPGAPPTLQTNEACTAYACVETQQMLVPIGSPDGNVCDLTAGGQGICLVGACVISTCGDGYRDVRTMPPEECDDGLGNSDSVANACRTSCRRPFCGDNVQDLGEFCDDGNNVDMDACRADCTVNVCGDGVVNQGVEQCDDGNDINEDACLNACADNTCGDGIRNPAAEACDDGNTNPNDGCDACRTTQWVPQVLLGFGQSGGDPLRLPISYPEGLAMDRNGNLFFADWQTARIWRLDPGPGGRLSRVAGTGAAGLSGDGSFATTAQLNEPEAVVLDERGNLYFTDAGNHVIRQVDRNGIITTLAGTGSLGFGGDDGPALNAQFNYPSGMVRDDSGNLLVADHFNQRIRRITPQGRVTTVVGTGTPGGLGDNGPGTLAQLDGPWGLLLLADGSLLIAERYGNRIRMLEPDGTLRLWAGTGAAGGDDGPRLGGATFSGPMGLARASDGTVYVADYDGHTVREVAPDGTVTTLAGTGEAGLEGDGGPAAAALLNYPLWLMVDPAGRLFIADEYNQRIRVVDTDVDRTITTVVGLTGPGYGGFGTRATQAFMVGPNGVAVAPDGSIYIAEYEGHRIRRVYSSGAIQDVVGTGEAGDSGDNGPGTAAQVSFPDSLAALPDGSILFTDSGNNRIRRLAADGTVTTAAGTGTAGFSGDGGNALAAELNGPAGITVYNGTIYFSDALNNRIRAISPLGTITTVAGDGSTTASGDGGSALAAGIAHVYGISVSTDGTTLYMADDVAARVRAVNLMTGIISTVAGTGVQESTGDGGSALAAGLSQPSAVLAVANGDLYISDTYGNRIRRIRGGTITTVVGTGDAGDGGDLGLGPDAQINKPYQLALHPSGSGALLVTDYGNGTLRRLDLGTNRMSTVAGTVHPGDGPFAVAQLTDPVQLLAMPDPLGWLVADGRGGRIRRIDTAAQLVLTVVGYPRAPVATATAASEAALLQRASGMAHDPTGAYLYLSEQATGILHRVTLLDVADPSSWVSQPWAGFAVPPGHQDGPLAAARFDGPAGMVMDVPGRTLYVTETANHVVRAIAVDTPAAANAVTTVAGIPRAQGFFEGTLAVDALLDAPEALTLATDMAGTATDLFIADTGNHRVRRVALSSGVITTVLGDGTAAASGQGEPSRFFPVDTPRGLALDAFGNLYVSSRVALKVLPAQNGNVPSGDGPVFTLYGAPPRALFPQNVTRCLSGVSVKAQDQLWLLDGCQGFVLELTRQQLP